MRHLVPLALVLALAGCGPATPPPEPAPVAPPRKPAPPPPVAPVRVADLQRLNGASFETTAAAATGKNAPADPVLIRAEVLLARARFSPGVIDGKPGSNFSRVLKVYQTAHSLPATGTLDSGTWRSLLAEPGAGRPVATAYTVRAADVAGPFAPDVGEDFVKLAALHGGPQFSSPLEALAERFHMSQPLLQALNPGADFRTAGQVLVVVDPAAAPLGKDQVKSITVSKSDAEVSAFDAQGRLLGVYPATVGSTERPSPSGVHKVTGVSFNPDYVYDPAKLNWGPRSHGKLVIKAGPNNPVGAVWINLNAPSYGIHGSPNPEKIGKTASHGCVRMTNWDAQALATGVRSGVTVTFEGERGGSPEVVQATAPSGARTSPPSRQDPGLRGPAEVQAAPATSDSEPPATPPEPTPAPPPQPPPSAPDPS